jgi:hypothetical protein
MKPLCNMRRLAHRGAVGGLLAAMLAALSGYAQVPQRSDIEQLSDGQLKALALHCDREASKRVLAFDEAALCSMGWEALKTRVFSGNTDALLSWWRVQRNNSASTTTLAH